MQREWQGAAWALTAVKMETSLVANLSLTPMMWQTLAEGRVMFPIDRLNLVHPTQAELGSLLLQKVGGVHSDLALRAVINDGGDGAPALLYFNETADPIALQPAPTSHSLWIGIGDAWELQLDPASSYNSDQRMPAAGDAFVWNGTSGFVAMMGYGNRYVTREGAILDELNWPAFSGFRRWRIVHWPARGNDPIVLFERNPED